MTVLLDRTGPVSPHVPAPVPSPFARWWGGWRVALRLARRDAWRGKGRSLLVVLLIALPVAVTSGVLVYGQAERDANTPRVQALRRLGTVADARLNTYGGPVRQTVDNGSIDSGDGTGSAPTVTSLLAALPPGSRLVSAGGTSGGVLEADGWGVPSELWVQDARDPLVAGMWHVTEGRLPATSSELALQPEVAARLRLALGRSVLLTPTSGAPVHLTLVGLVQSAMGFGPDGVVLPGVTHIDSVDPNHPDEADLLASTPAPLTWADVRRLNALGALVTSRSVLDAPPAFCPLSDVICLDAGPAAALDLGASTRIDPAEAARTAALAGVVVVLVILQIALLAGPAFAVQLRRRQRELGLVGASGGSSADLRRTVLASGVVLGLAGGLLGVLLGWTTVWLVGGVLPWPRVVTYPESFGIPALPPIVWGAALIGLVSAIVAAVVPARVAGRGDVVETLRGRRPLPPVRSSTPVLGLVLAGVGIALLLYGRTTLDPLVLGLGVLSGQLGLVLMMPWLVVQTGRIGRFLPVSPRLAVRDAGRHRLRTAAAACAIAAAAAAAVATGTWQTSQRLGAAASDVPYLAGQIAVTQAGDPTVGVTDADIATLDRVVMAAAPGASTVVLRSVRPRAATSADVTAGNVGYVACLAANGAASLPTPDPTAVDGSTCQGRTTWGGGWSAPTYTSGSVAVLEDPARLGTLLGPLADVDAAVRTLQAGGAVVLQPDALDAQGRVWLRASAPAADGSVTDGTPVAVPATEVLNGTLPASVVVGPRALAPGGALAATVVVDDSQRLVLVQPAQPDVPDRPTTADQLTVALIKAHSSAQVQVPGEAPRDTAALVLAAAALGTLLMALLAGLMVTALALADGRGDLGTLAAVGARPGVRRRMAASSAGLVSALGCAAGAVSGLVLGKLLIGVVTTPGARAYSVPWLLVLGVLVGIPVVTAVVAWATTRSRIVLTRRRD